MKKRPSLLPLTALLNWCQDLPQHLLTVLWLVSVHDPEHHRRRLPKPEIEAVKALLIDLEAHAPPGYFDLAARLVEDLPPCYATQTERTVYRSVLEHLRRREALEVAA